MLTYSSFLVHRVLLQQGGGGGGARGGDINEITDAEKPRVS